MPLTALFVLFDFVIHNPTHNETESDMAYLDQAVGHFVLLDSASNGELPGGIVSGFAEIARRHVAKARGITSTMPETPVGFLGSNMQRGHHGLGNSFISVRAVNHSGQERPCEGKIPMIRKSMLMTRRVTRQGFHHIFQPRKTRPTPKCSHCQTMTISTTLFQIVFRDRVGRERCS